MHEEERNVFYFSASRCSLYPISTYYFCFLLGHDVTVYHYDTWSWIIFRRFSCDNAAWSLGLQQCIKRGRMRSSLSMGNENIKILKCDSLTVTLSSVDTRLEVDSTYERAHFCSDVSRFRWIISICKLHRIFDELLKEDDGAAGCNENAIIHEFEAKLLSWMDAVWPSSEWIITLSRLHRTKNCVRTKKRPKNNFIHIIISSPFPLVKSRAVKSAIIIKQLQTI